MKRLILAIFLVLTPAALAQYGVGNLPSARPGVVPPEVPAVALDPAFPLRVHLLTARWGGTDGVYHGYGAGNLLAANATQGFDYGFQCDVPFVQNQAPDDTYQARWRREPYQMEILTGEVGTSHPRSHTCTLRLAFKERPFEPYNTAPMPHGVSSSLRVRWQDPDFAYEETAPDYPVQFHVIDGQRSEDWMGDHGWGTANVADPAGQRLLQGADFTYNCAYGFLTNSQLDGFYQGHWVKSGSQLEVLMQRPGSDKVDKCLVEVNLRPQPYPEGPHLRQPTAALVRPAQATP
jgi:hypothetical protein